MIIFMQDQDKLIFQIFLPSPLLRPYIQDYWYIENTQDVALTIPVLPDGCDNIIWNFYDTQNPVIE